MVRDLAILFSRLGNVVFYNVQGIALKELCLQLLRICLGKAPVCWGRKTASFSLFLLSDIWPISPQRQIFHLPKQPLCFCTSYRSNRCMDPVVTVLVPSTLLDAWELNSSSRCNKTDWDCFTKAVGHHRAKGSQIIHWLHYFCCWSWAGRITTAGFSSLWPYTFLCHSLVFIHSDRSLKVFLDHSCYAIILSTVMLQDSMYSLSWDPKMKSLFSRH